MSKGEKIMSKGEKIMSKGEKIMPKGEKIMPVGEMHKGENNVCSMWNGTIMYLGGNNESWRIENNECDV